MHRPFKNITGLINEFVGQFKANVEAGIGDLSKPLDVYAKYDSDAKQKVVGVYCDDSEVITLAAVAIDVGRCDKYLLTLITRLFRRAIERELFELKRKDKVLVAS